MPKNKDVIDSAYVKKQTLFGSVIVALLVGFVSGTIYSSFKLAAETKVPPQGSAAMVKVSSGEQDHDHTAAFASEILKIEQYLKAHPEDAEKWAQLGNYFFDSDQFENAISAYEKSLAIDPGKIGVVTDLGVMYRRNKQPEKAIEAFDKAISIDPSFETARFNKGIVLLHDLNDVEGGIRAWEELVEQNPMAMAPNGESVDALVQRMKNQK